MNIAKSEGIVYYGNFVTKKGDIYNAIGNKLIINNKGTVRIVVNGTKHTYLAGRVVWEAFNAKRIDKSKVIKFVDDNKTNASLDNIMVVERKEHFINHEWNYKLSSETIKQIVAEYNKAERKLHNFKGEYSKPTYAELSIKYNVSKSTILKVLNGHYNRKR